MFLGPNSPVVTLAEATIPNGFAGTAQTIKIMMALTDDASRDPQVVALAQQIVRNVPARDYRGEAATLLAWTQANVRYVRDPVGIERLTDPRHTLFVTRAEDCDGLAMVLGALAGAIGIQWGFRTIGLDPMQGTSFVHVYSLLVIDGKPVPADAMFQNPPVPLGWEPPSDDPTVRPFSPRQGFATSRADWWP